MEVLVGFVLSIFFAGFLFWLIWTNRATPEQRELIEAAREEFEHTELLRKRLDRAAREGGPKGSVLKDLLVLFFGNLPLFYILMQVATFVLVLLIYLKLMG